MIYYRIKRELGGIYEKGRRCGERLRAKGGENINPFTEDLCDLLSHVQYMTKILVGLS